MCMVVSICMSMRLGAGAQVQAAYQTSTVASHELGSAYKKPVVKYWNEGQATSMYIALYRKFSL